MIHNVQNLIPHARHQHRQDRDRPVDLGIVEVAGHIARHEIALLQHPQQRLLVLLVHLLARLLPVDRRTGLFEAHQHIGLRRREKVRDEGEIRSAEGIEHVFRPVGNVRQVILADGIDLEQRLEALRPHLIHFCTVLLPFRGLGHLVQRIILRKRKAGEQARAAVELRVGDKSREHLCRGGRIGHGNRRVRGGGVFLFSLAGRRQHERRKNQGEGKETFHL